MIAVLLLSPRGPDPLEGGGGAGGCRREKSNEHILVNAHMHLCIFLAFLYRPFLYRRSDQQQQMMIEKRLRRDD